MEYKSNRILIVLTLAVLLFCSVRISAAASELQHTNWDPSIDGDCTVCHVSPSTFLNQDYKDDPGFCVACHNPSGVGHDKGVSGYSHPVMAIVTTGGNRFPTYGNMTAAEANNQPFSRLRNGSMVSCITCHNTMQKTEDASRVWEYTSTSDNTTYRLQNGGWSSHGYLKPLVYSDTNLWSGPTYSKSKKAYVVDKSEYSFNEYSGFVRFNAQQPDPTYIYVTLDYPYLRASNLDNHLCLDCHTQATHKDNNCLVCHTAHNTANKSGVREIIRTTDLSERPVVFRNQSGMNSFADGDGVYDGICEVCHTATKYYRRDGSGFTNHSGGVDYSRASCIECHRHSEGFAYKPPTFETNTTVVPPTPTAPNLAGTRGGYKRIYVGLANPIRSGNDADFQYTMIYWKQGAYTDPYLDTSGMPTVGYYVLPNSDCGIPGKFTGTGTITTIFNDENTVLPNNVEPNLQASQYTLIAVSHYSCRGFVTNNTTASVQPYLCGDDPEFPGAPPINGGVNPSPPYQAYGGLNVTRSGGCLLSDPVTGVETRQPISFTFSYGGEGVIYDYAGVYVEKRENGTLLGSWGPLWSSFVDPAPALDSDGHHYDYWFKLADCAYVNGTNTTDITSDADAMKINGVAPGDITEQTGGKVVVFGSFSSIPGGSFYHNAVKFNIVNTAACNISLQSFDNITWNNADAYLQNVIIGPSTPIGGTAAYQQDVAVPDGSVLSGTNRVASVPFTTNPLIQDFGTAVGPSMAIPVTLVFTNSSGGMDQIVDMRNTTITLNAKYINTSTNGTCSKNGTISVSLGPVISGVEQDKPLSSTLPFAVPGSSGTNIPPAIIVDSGTTANVIGYVNDLDAALSSVKLYYKTTGQGVTSVDGSGFTELNLLNPSSNIYTLTDGNTDNRIPISDGLRVWYYFVARDTAGNFDTSPAAGNGYYTYDQKIVNICDKTPQAPVLTATKTTVGPTDYGHLSWTVVTKYTDGSDIQLSGTAADAIKYDVYRQDGFTGSLVNIASNLTALMYDDPTALTQPATYYVKAKNACTDPGPNVSSQSNLGTICAGTSASCAVVVDPSVASLNTNWSNHTLDAPVPVDLSVFICDRVNDGGVWDGVDIRSRIIMTISSAAEPNQIIYLYEVNGDSGVFKPLANPNIPFPTDADASKISITANPALYTGVTLVQGATTATNLSDTVTFTTDAGCGNVSASVAVSTDPCSNTPVQVTGVTTPTVTGSGSTAVVGFSWMQVTINTDGSTINDLVKYRIYKNDVLYKEVTTNSISVSITDFARNVPTILTVSAVDSCGNEGAKSAGVGFTR